MDNPATQDQTSELDAANARLIELEQSLKDSSKPASNGKAGGKTGASASPAGNRAPAADDVTGKKSTSTPDSKTQKTDTPSEADFEAAKAEADKEGKDLKLGDDGKPARGPDGKFIKVDRPAGDKNGKQTPSDDPNKSRYAKDFERRNGSWKELNDAKEAHKAEKLKFETEMKQAREALQRDQAAFQSQQQQAQSSQTPEAYEQWALKEGQKSAQLAEQAKAAEANGEFDKADQLREASLIAKGFEKMARQKAQDLRANPPATQKQLQEQQQAAMKEWTLKAATDFPEFAKKDSGVQKEAVAFLKLVAQQFPRFANTPELVYFAAQYADKKTAADRVPALEKELGDLRTKVTELEALTNPTPPGGTAAIPGDKAFSEMSSEEQYAQLRREAEQGLR